MVLSGPCGSGKTTLVRQLAIDLACNSRILFPEDDFGTFEEVVDYIFAALELHGQGDSTGEKLNEIYLFLGKIDGSSDRNILIVDNTERLPAVAIKQISYLSEASKSGNVRILFVGSTELKGLLNNAVLAPIASQIETWASLAYLTNAEVKPFINHCLKKAHYSGHKLFSPDAIESLVIHTSGNPRLIMNLCGFSLLNASIEKADQVTGKMIDDIANDCIFGPGSIKLTGNANESPPPESPSIVPRVYQGHDMHVDCDSDQKSVATPALDTTAVNELALRYQELGIPPLD